jgi:hypothetical protein
MEHIMTVYFWATLLKKGGMGGVSLSRTKNYLHYGEGDLHGEEEDYSVWFSLGRAKSVAFKRFLFAYPVIPPPVLWLIANVPGLGGEDAIF